MLKYNKRNLVLSEMAICLVISLVLKYEFVLFKMLNGGSVTLELVPIIIFCLRNKFKFGILLIIIKEFFKILVNFHIPPAANVGYIILSILLDYFLSNFCILLIYFFNKFLKNNISIILSLLAKFIIHFISGILIWNSYEISIKNSLKISFFYNISYSFPEICIIILVLKYSCILDFLEKTKIKRSD
ncbi:MAG: energy-coupled thiamine transporter ThiT [Candidatus Improbicoccus devescovinae]|nr:MAG: energy-coupled thiamine transporter ThiT [Candidatus Improbicoccus devescovinae]